MSHLVTQSVSVMAFKFLQTEGKDLTVHSNGLSVQRKKHQKSIGRTNDQSFLVYLNRVMEPLESLTLRVEHMGYQSAGHDFVIGMTTEQKKRLHSLSLSDDDDISDGALDEVRVKVNACAQGSMVRMDRADSMIQISIDDRILTFMDMSQLSAPVSMFFFQMIGDVKELRIVDPESLDLIPAFIPICFMVPDYPILAKIGHQKKMVSIPVSSSIPDQVTVYLNRDMAVGEKLVLEVEVHKGQSGIFAFGLTTCDPPLIRALPCHESGDCARNHCTRKHGKFRAKVVRAALNLRFSTRLLIERRETELVLRTSYKEKRYELWAILKSANLTPFIHVPKCVSHVTIPSDQKAAADLFAPKYVPKPRIRTMSLPAILRDDPVELMFESRSRKKDDVSDLCQDRKVTTRTRHRRYTECVVAATSHRFL